MSGHFLFKIKFLDKNYLIECWMEVRSCVPRVSLNVLFCAYAIIKLLKHPDIIAGCRIPRVGGGGNHPTLLENRDNHLLHPNHPNPQPPLPSLIVLKWLGNQLQSPTELNLKCKNNWTWKKLMHDLPLHFCNCLDFRTVYKNCKNSSYSSEPPTFARKIHARTLYVHNHLSY